MDLTKFIFRPIRGGLDESLRLSVSFDTWLQLGNYIYSTFHIFPRFAYYGYDDRISWNTFIVIDSKIGCPYGFAHFPDSELYS